MRINMNKFNTMKINVQIHMNGTQLQRQIYELNMSNKEIQKGNYILICVIKHWRSCVTLGGSFGTLGGTPAASASPLMVFFLVSISG